tara:strand:- start:584 stop:1048 length:465 start_codon:yes stop_codon:yes gene_type:complete
MKDLFGYEKPEVKIEDTLVCIKCETRQPIDQFNAMKYASSDENKKTEIKRTCRTCMRNQSNLVKELKKMHPYPNENYCCPICSRDIKEIGKYGQPRLQNWVLDHCHETLTFRGWLCHHCNVGLGGFNDQLTRLQSAVEYLVDHQLKEKSNETDT